MLLNRIGSGELGISLSLSNYILIAKVRVSVKFSIFLESPSLICSPLRFHPQSSFIAPSHRKPLYLCLCFHPQSSFIAPSHRRPLCLCFHPQSSLIAPSHRRPLCLCLRSGSQTSSTSLGAERWWPRRSGRTCGIWRSSNTQRSSPCFTASRNASEYLPCMGSSLEIA